MGAAIGALAGAGRGQVDLNPNIKGIFPEPIQQLEDKVASRLPGWPPGQAEQGVGRHGNGMAPHGENRMGLQVRAGSADADVQAAGEGRREEVQGMLRRIMEIHGHRCETCKAQG